MLYQLNYTRLLFLILLIKNNFCDMKDQENYLKVVIYFLKEII